MANVKLLPLCRIQAWLRLVRDVLECGGKPWPEAGRDTAFLGC